MAVTVDLLCAVLNGDAFLPDFLRGLDSQTHQDWRLWVRDDGSTDGTVAMLRARAAQDPRVHLIHVGGPKSGATRAFAWLLDHLPNDAKYVMLADADDVWLPSKIELSVQAMLAEEGRTSADTPILVHTDLVVVDAALREIHPSFWAYSHLDPEPAPLRRLIVRNVVTGPAMLLNRALCDRIGSMPAEAIYHDGWCAIVAAATGRIVTLRDRTVLYRQHGANAVGAMQSKAHASLGDMARAIVRGIGTADVFRHNLARTAAQAAAVERLYGAELSEADRRFVRAYASLPRQPLLRRKIDLARLHALRERGLLRNIGAFIRG